MAYIILWEFRPLPGREREFESAYGPDGHWAGLFREAAGFLGTELFQDPDDAGRYVTLDRWTSRGAFEGFRAQFRDRYEALDRQMEALASHEAHLGSFQSASPETGR